MSQLIHPLSVRDTVLDISDSIDFAVFKSGQNITVQRYAANTSSNTQHIYAIQVPSVNTVISRNVVWGSDVAITFAGSVQAYEYLYNLFPVYQSNNGILVQGADCPGPFMLHQLCQNMNIQINNTNVVQNNVQQILDPILRGLDREDIAKWYGSTPTQLDQYGNYLLALPQRNDNAGALAATVAQSPMLSAFNSPFNGLELTNCNDDFQSRGSFQILSIVGNTPAGSVAANKTVTVTFRVREPIICSPFLFNGDLDQSGLVGVTQINFTMSMDASAKRAVRWVLSNSGGATKSITDVSYANAYMEFMQYTPKADQLIPPTCVTPLSQFVSQILPSNGVLASGASADVTTNSLQLNSIPDKCIIWVDNTDKYGASGNLLPDAYATITGVNMTFNNQTGILSTFSQEQLFQASLKSGSKQTWAEFSGLQKSSYQPTPGIAAGSVVFNSSTCGSVLYLNFGDIINIAELWNAPGSLSTTQFQAKVSYTNNLPYQMTPQLNVMFLYSGILTTTNGNSSSYLNGILTRNDVLNANNAPYMAKRELTRYVGSGILNDLKSMAHNYLPQARKLLDSVDNKYAKLGANALKTVGYGDVEGGAISAGAMSGGRMRNKLM